MVDKPVGIGGVGTKGSYHLDKADKNMSEKQRKDTLEYNLRHAEDHLTKAREACEQLDKDGVTEDPPITKAMLDLFDYFEEAVGHTNELEYRKNKADQKLKKHIQEK